MCVDKMLREMTLADMFGERVPDVVLESLSAVGERDDRAMWVIRLLVSQVRCVREHADWYAGRKGAAVPGTFLSSLLRTGSDGDMAMAHRMRSLARAIAIGQPLRTAVFVSFVMTFETLFDELESVFDVKEVEELRRRIEALVGYLERAELRDYGEKCVGEVVDGMVGDFLADWKRLEERCLETERLLLGEPLADPSARAMQEAVDEIADDVTALRNRNRKSPAGATLQKRLLGMWYDYSDHPEWCRTDVAGRRVFVRDFWESVRENVVPQGIADLGHLQRVLKTARQNALRGALGADLQSRARERRDA